MYRLTVEKFVENENYVEGMKDKANEYFQILPSRWLPEKVLIVELTEEQFAAVKKAVLGVM